MIVCAPLPLDRPGEVYYGEIGGSFGIEADYAARTDASARFDEIAAAAAIGDVRGRSAAWTGQPRSPQRAS